MPKLRTLISLLVITFFAASLFAATQNAVANGPVQVIEVSARKYEFTPNVIHVKDGARVELKVHSIDATHGIKLSLYPEGSKDKSSPGLLFDNPKDNGKVEKGKDQVLTFVAQRPGTYDFKCSKFCGFGHHRMKGKLVVD
ncbi:MAG TPA: cupredoxin domain-containing protein [Candidatus Angelobacter sp.]|nr:cupredoxin domain-containing protein [Candidatus Angelobacter sp.]